MQPRLPLSFTFPTSPSLLVRTRSTIAPLLFGSSFTSKKGFQNKNRVAILAELDKEKRKLLMQNQSSTNHPGASIALARSPLNKDFRDHAEQQHIAAQQKAALQHAHAHSSGYFITQDSAFGNLILPVLPRLEAE
ncbi:SOSS complex subunit C isoform 1-T1 [Morus bassanus]